MGSTYDLIVSTALYQTFNLEKAVCNHGLFMMAPNCWNPSTKTLQRPLRLSDSTSVLVSIFSYRNNFLMIRLHDRRCLSYLDKDTILTQVLRMLRISKKDENDVVQFHVLHPQAKQDGFGRIFRSPTLFEDVVKSILLCNCGWNRTLEMAQGLCALQEDSIDQVKGSKATKEKNHSSAGKRKRSSNTVFKCQNDKQKTIGNFPNPKELLALGEEFLRERCNLGYRAAHIIRFANKFETGELKFIKEFDENSIFDTKIYDGLFTALQRLKGFGPFTCANILMCCGSYERIPQDSETARHLSTCHAREDCKMQNAKIVLKEVYGKYAPFQCLAYWWELVKGYEAEFGRLSEMPRSSYSIVTGSRTGRKN